jgi:sodium/potassium-transporting ATPase subunit alpha
VIGASDILLKRCSRFIEPNGTETEFNNEKRQLVEKKIDEWSFLGLRLVLLCKMYIQLDELSQNKDISTWFKTCFNLSYVGSIAFRDPPKMKVYDSIVAIRKLGLRVIMATGDYSITAASIAKEVKFERFNQYLLVFC